MRTLGVLAVSISLSVSALAESGLRAATFDIDATPPIGAPLAYGHTEGHWDLGLRAKGLVLMGAGEPIVLCAIDWIGVSNEGYDAFRETLASAAGTTPDRVALQALHQHDAVICDFSTERILKEYGHNPGRYDGDFAREVLGRLEVAVRDALDDAQPVTHIGAGEAEVFEVASNRRLLGEDGTVRAMRFTATADPDLRAEPEGLIDPMVSVISLWNGEKPVAVLSYYAVHPQSYYRTGIPNPDFPGVARFLRQLAVPAALHIHFTGAAGDIGAGKYNDGSHENRLILAERLADGMKRALEASERTPISADDVEWRVRPVMLPPADHLDADALREMLREADAETPFFGAATKLAWLDRVEAGIATDFTSLVLGPAQLLHLPAESFVAYQLAAKEFQPDRVVGVAAYSDYGAAYICTEEAYAQGGYEASEAASNVAPSVEGVIMEAIRELMAR